MIKAKVSNPSDKPTKMDSSATSDRFRLEISRKPTDSRPTIPYSQFPRPTLPNLSTSLEGSSRLRVDGEVTSSLDIHSPDNMDLSTPSTHRRRRSSLMNNLDWNARTPRTQSKQKQRQKGGTQDWKEITGEEAPLATSEGLELDSMSDDDINDDEETGLTEQDKRKRRRKRKRNSRIDQRIIGESFVTAGEKEANQTILKKLLINCLLISLWYLFSLSLSIYNTWMFNKSHFDFPFPLFTTSMHMLVQFSLASLVLYLLPHFRPRQDSLTSQHTNLDRSQHEPQSNKPLMTRWFYATRLGPCGMATGLDIGLGNMSLKLISLSFYTMCKSSSLAFVLLFAFLFRLESPSWRLVGIIGTMIVGVTMMVFGEINFEPLGFILVISAAFFSGFRWGLTQILLLRNPATSNPFSSIFFLAPIMFLTLALLAIPIEGLPSLMAALRKLIEVKGILGPVIILAPGVIAFLMTASEFALLQRTSVVTLSIAGIFKEVVTISAAGLIFDDKLTPINISGLFVTIGAIAVYNYIKISRMREDTIQQVHAGYAAAGHSGSDLDTDDEGGCDVRDPSPISEDGEVAAARSVTARPSSVSPVTVPVEGQG